MASAAKQGTDAAPTPGIDLDAVSGWLDSLAVGVRPPLRLSLMGQGKSNITVLVEDARDQRWVLRRPPLGRLLASAHDIAREHRILSALQGTSVQVPAVLALTADPAIADAPLMLMEHVPGLVIDELETAQRISQSVRRAIALDMVAALTSIHQVDLDATGLAGLASRKPYAARQLKRWKTQWEASRTRDCPVVDELAHRLAAAAPEQIEITLVHGDFHLRNVIVDPLSNQVRAILDWELATLGDPLADLGSLLAYWPDANDPPGALFPASALPGFPKRRELVDAYTAATGRDTTRIGFWEVLALWKVAIILAGVRKRGLDEPRNVERGAAVPEEAIDAVLLRASSTADAIGI